MEPAQRRLIQRRDQVPGLDVSHRITPSFTPPDALPASGRFSGYFSGNYLAQATSSRPKNECKVNAK
jgi:hypothetical protein